MNCLRCLNDFSPTNGAQKYCVQCKYKHMKENQKKYQKKALAPYDHRGWEGRIREATEKRAEFIANWYMETGVLLAY